MFLFRVTGLLGSGQFGMVNKGVWQSPAGAVKVAMKTLQSSASQEDRVKFLQEAAINGQFRHPNVVELLGVVTVGEPVRKQVSCFVDMSLGMYLMYLGTVPNLGTCRPGHTRVISYSYHEDRTQRHIIICVHRV